MFNENRTIKTDKAKVKQKLNCHFIFSSETIIIFRKWT